MDLKRSRYKILTIFILLSSWFGMGILPNKFITFIILPLILFTYQKQNKYENLLSFIALCIGNSLSYHVSATTNLLDNIKLNIILGIIISIITYIPIIIYNILKEKKDKLGDTILLFPTLWTLNWMIWRKISPFGSWGDWSYYFDETFLQLATISGLNMTNFIFSFLSIIIFDITNKFYNNIETENLIDVDENTPLILKKNKKIYSKYIYYFLIIISLLIFGNNRLNNIYITEKTNIIKAGCVLPPQNGKEITIDMLLSSTKTLASQGNKLILWSESAINLSSINEFQNLLSQVKNITKQYKFILGLTYSMPINNSNKKANMLSLIDHEGNIIFDYQKTHPVILAESYSIQPGDGILPLSNVDVPLRHHNKKELTIPLKMSGAICLDMDFPELLKQVSNADIVLSPAQTWSPLIGLQHLKMAATRSIEQKINILRCDAGGVSGFVDNNGRIRHWQPRYIFNDTEIFSIEIPFEENEKTNTIYSYLNDWPFIILSSIVFILVLFPDKYILLKNNINKLLFLKKIKIIKDNENNINQNLLN